MVPEAVEQRANPLVGRCWHRLGILLKEDVLPIVASIPAGHVYVRHLGAASTHRDDVVRLPDPPSGDSPDSPWWPPRMLTSEWVEQHASEFDVMHIHFGFDAISPEDLHLLAGTLDRHGKPLVLTVHDLRNPHHRTSELHDAQLGVLIHAAAAIITLTPGAANQILTRWGRSSTVLPHPHVVPEDWLGHPRPPRATFTIGVHAKSLRPNMDPLPLVNAIVDALPSMPAAVLRVDAHTDVMRHGYARRDPTFAHALQSLHDEHLIDLRVHDYFSDAELWTYLQGLDVSVLPYVFGTHSGWLEACRDLGTWVVAPDCGHYAEQRPCLSYASAGPERATSVVRAIGTAYATWTQGGHAPRAHPTRRRTEREHLAREHVRIYAGVLAKGSLCTS